MNLRDRIGKEWLFFDGGTGTILQEMGLKGGELPETWNLLHPENIIALYRSYLEAGANIFNANTFGANRLKYPENLEEIVTAGVTLAKEARTLSHREDAYIALDMGPTGKLLEPMGDLSFEDAVSLYADVVKAGAKAGADLVLIETMGDAYEIKAAVIAAKENCDLPIFVTMVFDESRKTLTGGSPESMTALLEGLHVDALGINCSLGPKQMLPIVKQLVDVASIPVIVNPNAGLPRNENGKTVYDIDADQFSDYMAEIAALGVHALGGCCGTTPEHIRKTIAKCSVIPFKEPVDKQKTLVSSYSSFVEIGPRPVIVGERINPTGKKKFKEALRNDDIDYILDQAFDQEEAGADILDVNVGLPEIDEPEMITEVIREIQAVMSLPLQIDTSDAEAMEQALRIYNGKPMVNSVNGKQESMDMVFPLVKKYGGVVVGLLLDENGIPATAEERIAIAEKIYHEAEKYGVPRKDIVLDALALTISSDHHAAVVTLDTLRRIRDDLKGHSILGVSNISFGLPQRENINSNFFTMAMTNGLSCAIINPNNAAMMKSYYSFMALMGLDPQCGNYIRVFANAPAATPANTPLVAAKPANSAPEKKKMTLIEYIERGSDKAAAQLTTEMLQNNESPLNIINEHLIPALDKVGKGFEKGTIFLPQLLMSAEAAKAAFDILKESMKDAPQASKGRIILATVKGDIHDIGKNIVKVLLENYGYDVLDLGKDVEPEEVVDAAIRENISLVGLSALMTTTVVSMESTIKLLKEKKPDTKTVVGGAVMNEEYAAQIGADFYAKDAMATVNYANTLFL